MKRKKVLSLVVVAAMTVSLAACGSTSDASADDAGTESQEDVEAEAQEEVEDYSSDDAEEDIDEILGEDESDSDSDSDSESDSESAAVEAGAGVGPELTDDMSYDDLSEVIYYDAFTDFVDAYDAAEATDNVSERYALQAQAEAYLLESGATLPLSSNGGVYAMSRVAPKTVTTVLWGADYYRYHNAVVTNEFITADDRAVMKEEWSELKGTGTYEEWVKNYLEEQGYTFADEYSLAYTGEPDTWDTMASSRSAVCEPLVNTYDGLMEYDMENELQPALAESYEVSEDGLQYTFHIREGVKWVDSQGRELGDVTADDWVAGLQHVMDAAGGLEYLVGEEGCNILNAEAYVYGEITDFSQVGVEAVDDYTLVYTLEDECPFFMTMLGYSILAPLNRDYYTSQGGKFGTEYDSSAADYSYGLDPDHIAYCGPYLITNATAENRIVFSANDSYWNADNINIQTVTMVFEDGSDATKTYNDLLSGVLTTASLNTSAIEVARNDGNFDQYAYITETDATTFQSFMNLNREVFANANDDTAVVSAQTEEDQERTNAAVKNQNFRLAVDFAFDRASYNAQSVGDDLKENNLRNTVTPGNFVVLEEDVTIDINGTETTFPEGTYYGEIMQAQIDADGIPITVWDPEAEDGIGSSDGYDGWYDPDNAMEYLQMAIDELADEGITIDADNPIYLDLPYPSNAEVYTNRANAYKQSVEASLDGMVIINLVECVDYDEWYYAGYYTDYGYEANYDLYDVSGWAPDYGDPKTYLGCFLPDYAGYMTKCFGIY